VVISPKREVAATTNFARGAKELGSRVLAVTADPTSPLGTLTDLVLPVPPLRTNQFGGSPFEQGALLVLDAVVMELTADVRDVYETMRAQHTNMQ
jgi:6-phospho-3-hexuloisomerase